MNFSPMIGLYFILGPMWFSLGCFLFDRKGLLCWPLVDLHSLIQYWTVSHLLHTIIFFFIISRKHLVSGNALLTIPFQMTLPYTIKTYDIFLKNLKISFFCKSSIMHNTFIYFCWSYFKTKNLINIFYKFWIWYYYSYNWSWSLQKKFSEYLFWDLYKFSKWLRL